MTGSEVLKYLKNPSLLSEETLPGLESLVREYSWFHPGWVLYIRNLKNLEDPEFASLLPQVALRVTDRRWLRDFLENEPLQESRENFHAGASYAVPDYQTGVAGDDSKMMPVNPEKKRLIDNFLLGGGDFKTLSNIEFKSSQVDLAEKAGSVSDGIITETFAQLLVSQEKYSEAVQAFEKLSLRFPEKSIYFATRIEDIKKIMNH